MAFQDGWDAPTVVLEADPDPLPHPGYLDELYRGAFLSGIFPEQQPSLAITPCQVSRVVHVVGR